MSGLKARFGHEENLSRHILESGLLHQLLNRAGLRVTGSADLERPVRHGAPGAAGRLDIFQPTTAGDVVVEVQYGMSDTAHRSRFDGYAKSVVNPVAIIWVAEGFRSKDVEAVAGCKIPVMLVTASLCESEVMLKCRGGARLAVQSLDKRVAKANEKAWELVKAVDWVDQVASELRNRERMPDWQLLNCVVNNPYLFAKTRPAGEKCIQIIRTCGDADAIAAYIKSFFEKGRLKDENWRKEKERRHLAWAAAWQKKWGCAA